MRDKLFLEGGTFVPPFSNACLPFLHAVLVQDRIAPPDSGSILHIPYNPPFLILTHFFRLLRALPLCLLLRGYVRAADIYAKGNFKIHLSLNPERGALMGCQLIPVDGGENIWYLCVLVMVRQVAAIIPFVPLARPQGHAANGAWSESVTPV